MNKVEQQSTSRLELNVNNNKKEENLENSSSYIHGDKKFLDMNQHSRPEVDQNNQSGAPKNVST